MSTDEVKKDDVKKQSELISYAIFGVATTVVSMVVYGVCNSAFEMHYLISNIISWVIAVAFAYITNKMFVFKTRGMGFAQLKREITLFVSARLASLGIEELGLF
ncbi:MAG: GtrA family protein, partial [Firmicutes bacterium]|nr:GtrA family protein [Bacillota bacterium]